ncbi:MAG: hypothetical protein IPF68_07375 [Bacteroidales bacterium]|nr:hypothetical protein [Bacteroidales bacterium]
MKTNFKFFAITCLLFSSLSMKPLFAQEKTVDRKTILSVETDPSTFLFGGYAFHIRLKPAGSDRLVIGAGTYAMDFPAFLVDLNEKNKAKGWNVRINSAFGLFGEYYFNEANKGWFAGLQAGIQNYKNSMDPSPGKHISYSNLLIMPSAGVNWQPFDFPLYLKPWAGLGFTGRISGQNTLEGNTFDISTLSPFVTLHVGYAFSITRSTRQCKKK